MVKQRAAHPKSFFKSKLEFFSLGQSTAHTHTFSPCHGCATVDTMPCHACRAQRFVFPTKQKKLPCTPSNARLRLACTMPCHAMRHTIFICLPPADPFFFWIERALYIAVQGNMLKQRAAHPKSFFESELEFFSLGQSTAHTHTFSPCHGCATVDTMPCHACRAQRLVCMQICSREPWARRGDRS